jgi:DNA-binding response OmpR family regulator
MKQMDNDELEPTENAGNAKRRILVADDDPAILRLVTAILEKENYGVVAARDGREAYKILQSGQGFTAAIFDVVCRTSPGLNWFAS